jgi:hypothetical protein
MNLQEIALTSAGATIDPFLGLGNAYQSYYVTGTATLAANISFASSTNVKFGSYIIWWDADITLSTFSVTIEGQVINQDSLNQGGIFSVYYNGSAWVVNYSANGIEQPQENRGVNSVAVPSGGGTLTLVAGVNNQYQRLSSSAVTLSSNYTITAATSGVKDGTTFLLDFVGNITTSGNTITAFGVSIPAAQALAGGMAVLATFDATAVVWRAITINKPVTLSTLSNQAALTVVANATNASAPPTALPFATDGDVLQRSGTSIVASLLSAVNFGSTVAPIKYATYNLSSSEILNSFTTPVTILAGVAGLTHVPLFVVFETTFGTTAYATNTNGIITSAGAASRIVTQTGLLAFAASGLLATPITGVGSFTTNLVKGAALTFSTLTGNPTAGDGTILVHIYYIDLA